MRMAALENRLDINQSAAWISSSPQVVFRRAGQPLHLRSLNSFGLRDRKIMKSSYFYSRCKIVCDLSASSSPSSPTGETEQPLPILALPMTAGNDILFPGCGRVLTLNEASAQRVLSEITENDPPEFGYITLNAWGDPAPVGTVAIIDDFQYVRDNKSILSCSGVARFRINSINREFTEAKLQVFHDDIPSEDGLDSLVALEKQVISTMKDIISLTIKVTDDKNHTRQRSYEETMKRIESLVADGDVESVQHWMLNMNPNFRREILSFIIIDLLDISYMDRCGILESTDTADRLDAALKGLQPFIRELAAKGAIIGALGRGEEESSDFSGPSTN